MQHDSNNPVPSVNAEEKSCARSDNPTYAAPIMYVIGHSNRLMQGSGRHKNDDTGSRGFVVDQH